ncbi:MAG: flippase [Bacteroidales bacterium]
MISKIIKIIPSGSEGKTVVKNFGYLSLLQIAGYAFPLITMPYLARVIGANGFGKIAFASAIIVWIQTIADWGFNYTATRDVAQNKDNIEKVSEIFSNVLWSRCFLMLLSLVILIIAIIIIPSFQAESTIILVTFIMVPGHILFPDWFFQALEKMKYTTIFNIIIKIIFSLLVFIVIKEPDDYIYQPLFISISYVVCGFISMWLIIKKWKYKILKPELNSIVRTIKYSTDVFLNNLFPNLYNSMSVMLLGVYGGSLSTGIFDGGNKFISISQQFHSVIARSFFPFLVRRTDKHSVFVKINILTGVFISFFLFMFSPFIIEIMLGPDFEHSVFVLRLLAISLIFLIISNTYGTNYLIIIHKERLLRRITMICSVIGMIFSYPLIKYYSFVGAALTILISRFLLGVTIYLFARKVKLQMKK